MAESFLDEEQEDIQRALNDAKKRELEEKHGTYFPEEQSKLPLDVESQWLCQGRGLWSIRGTDRCRGDGGSNPLVLPAPCCI